MNDNNTDSQRRQALKKIVTGSSVVGALAVVPDKWVKTILHAVVPPAHAQHSPAFMLPANAIWAGCGGGCGIGRATVDMRHRNTHAAHPAGRFTVAQRQS